MRKSIIAFATTALGLTALPTVAADNGIYLGGSIGQTGVQIDDLDYDADATSYKVIAGWRFLDWLAVEGNYIDFGSADDRVSGTRLETDLSGVSLSAVGFLPAGPVDLFARVGAVDWSADLSQEGFGCSGWCHRTWLTSPSRHGASASTSTTPTSTLRPRRTT
jgi:hypothetical protein